VGKKRRGLLGLKRKGRHQGKKKKKFSEQGRRRQETGRVRKKKLDMWVMSGEKLTMG